MTKESREEVESLERYGLNRGLLLGLGVCSFILLVYMVEYTFLVHWGVSITVLLLILLITANSGIQFRNRGKGHINFMDGFKLSLIMLITASILQISFNVALYNFIDPELPQMMTKASLESTERLMRSMGSSPEQIQQQMTQLEIELPQQFTIEGQLKNSWAIIIVSAVLALLSAAIMRKKETRIDLSDG